MEGRVPAQEDVGDDPDAPHVHRRIVLSVMVLLRCRRAVPCRTAQDVLGLGLAEAESVS